MNFSKALILGLFVFGFSQAQADQACWYGQSLFGESRTVCLSPGLPKVGEAALVTVTTTTSIRDSQSVVSREFVATLEAVEADHWTGGGQCIALDYPLTRYKFSPIQGATGYYDLSMSSKMACGYATEFIFHETD